MRSIVLLAIGGYRRRVFDVQGKAVLESIHSSKHDALTRGLFCVCLLGYFGVVFCYACFKG
jgi:hypothetical protein